MRIVRIFIIYQFAILIFSSNLHALAVEKDKLGGKLSRLDHFENNLITDIDQPESPGSLIIIARDAQNVYEEVHFYLTNPVSKYFPKFKDLVITKNEGKGKVGETEPLKREITIVG